MAADPKPEDWAVLGVRPGVGHDAARAAYVARARALHPDAHPDASAALRARLDAAMAALNEAWDRVERSYGTVPPARPARVLPEPPAGFATTFVGVSSAVGDQLQLMGVSADLLGLRALAGEPVRVLRCADRPLVDEHVDAIGVLRDLRILDLDGTGITDRALDVLADLPRLTDLRVSDTSVTDVGLALIARLPSLHSLSVAGTEVTDDGLRALAGHARLGILNLRGTRVRGAGLLHLASCPRLRLVGASGVGRQDRQALQRLRPDISFV